jgi:hypothetical protein
MGNALVGDENGRTNLLAVAVEGLLKREKWPIYSKKRSFPGHNDGVEFWALLKEDHIFSRHIVVTVFVLLVSCGLCHAAQPDSGLFTTYNADSAKTALYWTTCGSIAPGSGCYASGQFGPFGQIGSVVEGSRTYNKAKGTVTRHIYIVDQASGSGQDEVVFYDYKRVDTIVNGDDSVATTLVKSLSLPLTGGTSATVFLGANSGYLLIGTSLTTIPVEVTKANYAVTPVDIISQVPESITADNYGFITVTSANGFFVVGPNGQLQEDGGGAPFLVNEIVGIQPLPFF